MFKQNVLHIIKIINILLHNKKDVKIYRKHNKNYRKIKKIPNNKLNITIIILILYEGMIFYMNISAQQKRQLVSELSAKTGIQAGILDKFLDILGAKSELKKQLKKILSKVLKGKVPDAVISKVVDTAVDEILDLLP